MQRVIDEMAKAKGDIEKRYRNKIPEIIRECMVFAYLGKSFTFDANAELDRKVNQKLIALSDEIMEDIEARAKRCIAYAEDEEDEDAILAYMKREQNGEDLLSRIDKHNSNFRYFLEGWMAIGIVNGLSQGSLLANIMTYMANPYISPLWQDAFKEGYLSNSIRTRGYSFGKGNMRNPIDALMVLAQDSINRAFQQGRFLRFGKDGAVGYTIHRGSSFDCPYCDSFTGIVHPMTECLLPLHPRCVCWSKPVFDADALSWDIISVNKGSIRIHKEIDRNSPDFNDILESAYFFANRGSKVLITPQLSRSSQFDYDSIYGSLRGTAFDGKCPDLKVDDWWYEHEGFISSNPKNAFRNMMKNGLEQSNRIIINAPGLTEAYIKRSIWKRINQDKQDILEVWIKRDKELINIYKKLEE